MKYRLYDDNYTPQGSFSSIQELRNYLCDRKYEFDCDKDISHVHLITLRVLNGHLR